MILLPLEYKFKTEGIDLNVELAGIVLQNGGKETLSEEEAREPEDLGLLLVVHPLLQCPDTQVQISNIAGKRFQRRIRDLFPGIGHKSMDQLGSGRAQLLRH